MTQFHKYIDENLHTRLAKNIQELNLSECEEKILLDFFFYGKYDSSNSNLIRLHGLRMIQREFKKVSSSFERTINSLNMLEDPLEDESFKIYQKRFDAG